MNTKNKSTLFFVLILISNEIFCLNHFKSQYRIKKSKLIYEELLKPYNNYIAKNNNNNIYRNSNIIFNTIEIMTYIIINPDILNHSINDIYGIFNFLQQKVNFKFQKLLFKIYNNLFLYQGDIHNIFIYMKSFINEVINYSNQNFFSFMQKTSINLSLLKDIIKIILALFSEGAIVASFFHEDSQITDEKNRLSANAETFFGKNNLNQEICLKFQKSECTFGKILQTECLDIINFFDNMAIKTFIRYLFFIIGVLIPVLTIILGAYSLCKAKKKNSTEQKLDEEIARYSFSDESKETLIKTVENELINAKHAFDLYKNENNPLSLENNRITIYRARTIN